MHRVNGIFFYRINIIGEEIKYFFNHLPPPFYFLNRLFLSYWTQAHSLTLSVKLYSVPIYNIEP